MAYSSPPHAHNINLFSLLIPTTHSLAPSIFLFILFPPPLSSFPIPSPSSVMTADIGSRVYGYSDEAREAKRSGELVTRDLLGGCAASSSSKQSAKELDLDPRIPSGWERRLDLLSGEMYLKKSNPDPIQDLNLPPPPPAVDLKLLSSTSSAPPPFDHQCTLEKVKSALERAGRETSRNASRWSMDGSPSPSSSSSTTSSSSKRRTEEATADGSKNSPGSLAAAGCSKCLMYVLISSRDPRCPRCGSYVGVVPPASAAAVTKKKQRREPMNILDLNLNSNANGANL